MPPADESSSRGRKPSGSDGGDGERLSRAKRRPGPGMARLLRESEARYRALAEAAGAFVFAADAVGALEDGTSWEAYSGQAPGTARGRGWLDAVHPDDRERVEREWAEGIASGRAFPLFVRADRADGERRLLQCRAVPVVGGGDGGQTREWVIACADVTGQAQRERALAEEAHGGPRAPGRADALLENVTDGFLAMDMQGHITYVNAEVERVVGRGRDELLGRNVWDAFSSAVGLPIHREYERVMSTRTPARFEAYYPPLDMWLEARLYPLPTGVAAYFGDITERKRAEEQRARQLEEERAARAEADAARAEAATGQARFSSLMESNVVGVVVTDGERVVEANDAFLGMLGYTRDDLAARGLRWSDITPEEDRERDRLALTGVLAREDAGPLHVAPLEKEYLHRDGSRVPVLLCIVEVEHEPLSALCFVMDLSVRKRLERELAERASALEAVFEATPDGLAFFDAEARALRMNAAYRRLLGYEETGEVEPVPAGERAECHGPPDGSGIPISVVEEPLARALRGETLSDKGAMDVRFRGVDGSECDLSIGAAPLRDETGHVRGAVLVVHDMTGRRALERQRTDILRIVAHDLANPVSAMKLYVQMQERRWERGLPLKAPDPQALEWLGHILVRMERLLADLRTAASVEAGALRLERGRVELGTLCRREADMQREATGRDVALALPDGPAEVDADGERIGQVLGNLLSNALKYSPPEHPVLLTLRVEEAAARISVTDKGPGIPPRELAHIWEQFHRVEGIRAQQGFGGGLGLGLFISRSIVERHGGEIGVESTVGEGSTFWFTLPLGGTEE